LKIATILGARPQFIKAAEISEKINLHDSLSELIIHTGQHYSSNMSNIFFQEMNIPNPKYNLEINQMEYGLMIDRMVEKIYPILLKESVNGVLVYGDTNSTLAASLCAKKLNLPIFHVEAGLRSGNRSMFEENNRIITDHLSSLLFCPTENAMDNLKNENLIKRSVLSGDVMYDTFLKYSARPFLLNQNIKKKKYILSTIHRRENINSPKKLSVIFKNLDKINNELKIIMPLHPHTKKKIKEYKIKTNVEFINPVGYISMLSILNNCKMVITDSGGLQKESFFAKKKCLTVRTKTEWVELIDNKANILIPPKKIYYFYRKFINSEIIFTKNPLGDGNASSIILDSIMKFFN
tara:strand:+ start:191 stop:1243 length:1053 start_codon:yes stop_codon:yes gene_type:complete